MTDSRSRGRGPADSRSARSCSAPGSARSRPRSRPPDCSRPYFGSSDHRLGEPHRDRPRRARARLLARRTCWRIAVRAEAARSDRARRRRVHRGDPVRREAVPRPTPVEGLDTASAGAVIGSFLAVRAALRAARRAARDGLAVRDPARRLVDRDGRRGRRAVCTRCRPPAHCSGRSFRHSSSSPAIGTQRTFLVIAGTRRRDVLLHARSALPPRHCADRGAPRRAAGRDQGRGGPDPRGDVPPTSTSRVVATARRPARPAPERGRRDPLRLAGRLRADGWGVGRVPRACRHCSAVRSSVSRSWATPGGRPRARSGVYYPKAAVDGVELDPAVSHAHRLAVLRHGRQPAARGTQRRRTPFLRSTDERYDLIVVDAYRQPYVPFYLATREFFRLVRDHLTPGGIVVLERRGRARRQAARRREWAGTLAADFPKVLEWPALRFNTFVLGLTEPLAASEPDGRLANGPPRRWRRSRDLARDTTGRLPPVGR